MRVKQVGLAALFAVTGAVVAIGAAPIAVADECDPSLRYRIDEDH